MRLLFIPTSSFAVLLFSWFATGALNASPGLAIMVDAPRPNTKLVSATGSNTIYRPLDYDRSQGLKHPPPFLPSGAAAKKLGGEIELSVETTKSGDVKKVILVRSSGSPLLDETARVWVQCVWRYPDAGQTKTYQERIRFKTTGKDIIREASDASSARSIYPNTPRPPYPGPAIYMGWQGSVRMKLVPDGAGRVKEAKVIGTSKIPLLDLTAKGWCESYWKLPGNAATDCTITFKLF